MKSDNRLQCHVVHACVTKKRESCLKVSTQHTRKCMCAYDETCIITDLAIVSSSYAEFADELFQYKWTNRL